MGNMAQWLYPLTGYRWMPVRCELEITLKALVVSESKEYILKQTCLFQNLTKINYYLLTYHNIQYTGNETIA